ncbi:MAG TPA: FtsX-like permease family protein [Paracoccaceae bacterium]|nr:FtsX-like permease family protein [Paracoccaceae bacterium]
MSGAAPAPILRALLSHWRRRPLLLVALLLGLAAATALWTGVQALNAEARAAYDRAAESFSGGGLDVLVARDGGAIPQSAFPALRRAGWPVSPVVEGRVAIGEERLRLLGLEPISLPAAAGLALFGPAAGGEAGAAPVDFAPFVTPPGRTLIAPETLDALGLAPGDRPETPNGPLPPLTPAPSLAPGLLVADIGFAQPILGLEGALSRLMIGESPRPLPPLEDVAPALRRQAAAPAADPAQLSDSFHLNLTAFGLLAFAVGLFIVHGAVGLAFEQRRPLFRTLRACGVSARGLAAALLAEITALALIAGLAGVALGGVVASVLLPDVALSLRGLYGARVPGELSLSPVWVLAGLGMSLAGALAAAAGYIAKAATLPVLEAARPEAWRAAAVRRLRLQTGGALALGLAALVLIAAGQGLPAGFALLGAILVGAALALPPLLALALAGLARLARSPLARWAVADARQNLGGLSLALMALLLALAVNIGVGTMVGGFRLTFTTWLEDRLAAEAYVSAPSPEAAAELRAWMADRPEVRAVLPERRAETVLAGLPVEVVGFRDHATYRERWPLLAAGAAPWDRVAAGEAALISEQLARRLDLAPGDRLRLPAPGGARGFEVAAVYADYGNPKGQVRLSLGAHAEAFPGPPPTGFGVRLDPGATDAFLAALTGPEGPPVDRSIDQAGLKRLSTTIFDRTFAVTAALNVLTFAVAGLALLTALATLGAARLPQLAPLWALGVPRRRLAAMELGKTMALALMTALAAVPLGVALAWALVAVVNVEAFGWRLPLHLFPGEWARLVLLALGVSAIAAAAPLLRLARTPPSTLAKVFADER